MFAASDEEAAPAGRSATGPERFDDVADSSDHGTIPTMQSQTAITERDTVLLSPDHPPRLDTFRFSWKPPLLYLLFLIFCNVAVPCMIFYPANIYTKISDEELIGIGSAALGVSSCFDAPIRVWRLTRHRAKYGPLYYPFMADPAHEPAGKNRLMKRMPKSWWHMDFMMHTYTIALFFFAIPLAVAPAIPLYSFFLFSFPMLVAPVAIVFTLTLKSWTSLPFWMSSDPPKTPTKPGVYYFIEDTGAVDFRHGREWRKRCQARYAASPLFRELMWWQTVLWIFGMAVFIGSVAAVDWTTTLDVGFGVCISLIFPWAILWGLISYAHVHWSLKRELEWWRTHYSTMVVPNLVRRGESDVVGPRGTGAGVEPPRSGPRFLQSRHRGYSVHADLEVPPAAATAAAQEPEMRQIARAPRNGPDSLRTVVGSTADGDSPAKTPSRPSADDEGSGSDIAAANGQVV